ncbi:MAG: hypothetical protein JO279_17275 [Verrucomicrobia bacterium]|nr:hypothetical protein [Verrucomicrobiota bacterium]
MNKALGDTTEEFAEWVEGLRCQTAIPARTPAERLLEKKEAEDPGGGERSHSRSLEELISALARFETSWANLRSDPHPSESKTVGLPEDAVRRY